MCQFLKLPVFFEHYKEHQSINSNISLVDFLSMHYWGDDLNDDDDDRDMQLPFKKIDIHQSTYPFITVSKFQNSRKVGWPIKLSYAAYQPNYYPTPFIGSPFRPPCA